MDFNCISGLSISCLFINSAENAVTRQICQHFDLNQDQDKNVVHTKADRQIHINTLKTRHLQALPFFCKN
jgi:hypothetical protein